MLLLKNQVRFIRNPTKTSSELRLLLKRTGPDSSHLRATELPTFSILLKEELIPQFLHLCSGGWIQATEPSATDALWFWPDPLQARSLASGAHGCSWKHSDWPQQTPSDPTQVICVNLWWESCKGCRYLSLWQIVVVTTQQREDSQGQLPLPYLSSDLFLFLSPDARRVI